MPGRPGSQFVLRSDLACSLFQTSLWNIRGDHRAPPQPPGWRLWQLPSCLLDGKPRKAIRAYRKAAELDEKTFGDHGDPPGWWYPVRRSLAAAQLAEGDAAGAAKSARAALNRRPLDPVALHLLSQAERATGQTEQADRHLAQARKGWVGDLAKLDLANS